MGIIRQRIQEIRQRIQEKKMHIIATKHFLNVPLQGSDTMVHSEMGRSPLQIRSKLKCIAYWLRLVKLPPSRMYK